MGIARPEGRRQRRSCMAGGGAIGAFAVALGLLGAAPVAASAQTAQVATGPAPLAGSSTIGVTEIPISFQVQNVNRSKVPCPADGATYTVRGHLVAPASAAVNASTVTLYLHGLGLGEFFWNFSDFGNAPGYHYADTLAQAGQTSVIVDRLGYGASDKPPGTQICLGSQADIAHQEVQDLRAGNYTLGNAQSPQHFSKVVLAGHSVGGLITQIEAYSFGGVDAIVNMDFSDQGMSALTMADFAQWQAACSAGGTTVTDAGGPGGYAPFAQAPQVHPTFFSQPDPAIEGFVLAGMVRDPCGDQTSFMAGVSADMANLGQVHVPVLLLFGDKDALFPVPDGVAQMDRFTGSPSVTYAQVPGLPHAVTLEPAHLLVAAEVEHWLVTYVETGQAPRGAV